MARPSNILSVKGTIGSTFKRLPPKTWAPAVHTTDSFGLSGNHVMGVEVEVEGIYIDWPEDTWVNGMSPAQIAAEKVADFGWGNTEDGSLRNGGAEYISRPMACCYLSYALEGLFKTLPDTADFHPRAGIHIHVNTVDMKIAQVQRALLLYILFEPMLFQLTATHRRNNIFCVPVHSADAASDILLLTRRRRADAAQKYLALNIETIRTLGTIEFRHLQSTNDMEVIGRWLKVIDSIFTYAKRSEDFEGLLQQVFNLTSNSMFDHFGQEVFGSLWSALCYDNYPKYLNDSIAMLKSTWIDAENTFAGPALVAWTQNQGNDWIITTGYHNLIGGIANALEAAALDATELEAAPVGIDTIDDTFDDEE